MLGFALAARALRCQTYSIAGPHFVVIRLFTVTKYAKTDRCPERAPGAGIFTGDQAPPGPFDLICTPGTIVRSDPVRSCC